jgi:hypothetical protein
LFLSRLALSLFWLRARDRESAKKAPAPTSGFKCQFFCLFKKNKYPFSNKKILVGCMQNDAFTSGLQPANHYFGSLQKEANTLLKDLIKVLCTFPERVCMSSHQVLCKQAIFLKTYSENFV